MKKVFAILACLSMIAMTSCSSSDNPTVSEQETSEETTTTTEAATTEEPTEAATKAQISLDKEYTFEDLTFSVPFSANKIGSMPAGSSTLTYINFNDSSEMQVSVTENTSGVPFSTATSEQLSDVLESYANSFSSSFTDKGELEKVTLSDGIAFKQVMKKNGNLTIVVHILYNERIYTVGFIDTQGDDTTTAPSIADDVIKSMRLAQIESTTENTDAKSLSFNGNGDTVTDIFTANGCTKIKGEYNGDSVFFVTLYDSEGNSKGMIFSNMGQYSGEKVFKFETDAKYMFEVTAGEGDWEITVE